MTAEQYHKIAKFFLLIPLLTGLLTIAEQFLPLQKVSTVVAYKSVRDSSKSGTTYSIDFVGNNDQFTEEIYNTVNEGDTVNLEVMYFTKEVKTLQLPGSVVLENSTSEIYFQLGIALAFILFGVCFLRKNYLTKKNIIYIVLLCVVSLVSLMRIISLNL